MKKDNEFLERRQGLRYPIELPVEAEQAAGRTRDMSFSGIYFETESTFSPETQIELTLLWKPTLLSAPMRIKCKGQVVRVERQEGKLGVAIAIEAYGFEMSKSTK
ncbi:MAG: PilZ domain-containing protein [Thermodesulfobacteriota bacterium]